MQTPDSTVLQSPDLDYRPYQSSPTDLIISRADYLNRLQGFWLGQCIGNWTGLVTEMDKIGGEGIHGEFYTRADWGRPDQPAFGERAAERFIGNHRFCFRTTRRCLGADDDTDIEYMYQHLLLTHQTSILSGSQIRDGWLKHIYSDENTPFVDKTGKPENYLWVSNQRAHDLMRPEV